MTDTFPPLPHERQPAEGVFSSGSNIPVGSVPWPGIQQPNPVSTSQSPSDPPKRRSRRALIAVTAVVLVVLSGAAIGIAVASNFGHYPTGSPPAESVSESTTVVPDVEPPSKSSGVSDTGGATPSMPSAPVLPNVSADIDMEAVSTDPHLPQVARLLDTYYSGINAHDGARAASVFSPDGSIDPQSAKAVAAFEHNIRTSHDDQIVVLSITPGLVGARQGLIVHVTFRSQQAAAFGPDGATCSNWDLEYQMPFVGSRLLLKDSVDVSNVDCD